VQVNSNSVNKFRGQTGVIRIALLKRGSGKNKGKWMYTVKINGLAFDNEKDVQLFEAALFTLAPNENRPAVGGKVSSRKSNNSKKSKMNYNDIDLDVESDSNSNSIYRLLM
jgi:hypothetical protein